jgi:hypothetical protein
MIPYFGILFNCGIVIINYFVLMLSLGDGSVSSFYKQADFSNGWLAKGDITS